MRYLSGIGVVIGLVPVGAALSAVAPALGQCEPVELQKLLREFHVANQHFGKSAGLSASTAIVGGPRTYVIAGSASIYREDAEGHWDEVATVAASDGTDGDSFGSQCSISGDTAIVGALYADNENGIDAGAAYIYEDTGNDEWPEVAKLIASDGDPDDAFGEGVAITGDLALVGASGNDSTGAAYVFRRDEFGEWIETTKLTASDGEVGDAFGNAVAASGNTLAIAARRDDTIHGVDTGSVYIFRADGLGDWVEIAKLVADDATPNREFGHAVAISGDTVIVGPWHDHELAYDAGAAYVFREDGAGNWMQVQKLLASDGSEDDQFGRHEVAIDGDVAAVGAIGDDDVDEAAGAVYVFRKNDAGVWIESAKLTASDGGFGNFFGSGVAVAGGNVVVGAEGDNDNGNNSGSAYMFDLNCCPADISQDDVVDVLDLLLLLAYWGQSNVPGDLNGDGIVDVLDLLELLASWGPCE